MWGKVSKLELNTLIMICKEMSLRHPSANLGWRPVIAGMTVQYTWWDVNCLGSTTVNSSSVWPWTCLPPLCPAAEQDTAAGSICSEITKERVLSSPSTHLLPQWSVFSSLHACLFSSYFKTPWGLAGLMSMNLIETTQHGLLADLTPVTVATHLHFRGKSYRTLSVISHENTTLDCTLATWRHLHVQVYLLNTLLSMILCVSVYCIYKL